MKFKILLYIFLMTTTLWASDTVKEGRLEWQDNKEVKTTKLNWKDAKVYCEKLSFSGRDDWRLPSIQELQSIVDIRRIRLAIKRSFKNTVPSSYWSSSQGVFSIKSAWNIYFENGATYSDPISYKHSVRCVRIRQ